MRATYIRSYKRLHHQWGELPRGPDPVQFARTCIPDEIQAPYIGVRYRRRVYAHNLASASVYRRSSICSTKPPPPPGQKSIIELVSKALCLKLHSISPLALS